MRLLRSTLLQTKVIKPPNERQFWYWLNHAWNTFDDKRVEEVGPNRACAEWLLKCGGQVKFKNWGTYTVDYNKMPPGGYEQFLIEEIRAENACIMARGFEYFNGLQHVKKVKFINCELIDDPALAKLSYLRNSLKELQLVFLPTVTDVGISYLYLLKFVSDTNRFVLYKAYNSVINKKRNLQDLYINYMPNVKDYKLAERLLKENLPGCKVEFIQGTKPDDAVEKH